MEALFEGLSISEIQYLIYLQERGYFDGFEMFLNMDTSSDYRVEKLVNGGYIEMDEDEPYAGAAKIAVTEKGRAALVDYDTFLQMEKKKKREKVINLGISLVAMLAAVAAAVFGAMAVF